MKILFLNPPGKKLYLRDYFCSKVSQADYINHPVDLLYLSGWFRQDHDLYMMDAIVEKLSVSACLDKIEQLRPDVVVGLIGSVSLMEDIPFYKQMAERISIRLFLIGDVLIDSRSDRLKELNFVEGFLHDFSGDDLYRYLSSANEEHYSLKNMTLRQNGGIRELPLARPVSKPWNQPQPAHELFSGRNYRHPFVRNKRFATILTEYGCPYPCNFCIMSTLGWKVREIGSVLDELNHVKDLGFREILFLDQTFGIRKDRTLELLSAMSNQNHGLGWVCFSRPDILSDELLAGMKAAGCHTIILGLESGSDEILSSAKKGYDKKKVHAGFELCKEHGIRTVATVIIGLPEETETTFAQTLSFLKEVRPDFASFNVAVPRMDTPLRQKALDFQLIQPGFQVMDQSGSNVAMPSLTLSRRQIARMKSKAIRRFYFNPQYIGSRLRDLCFAEDGAWDDFRIQARQGWSLLRNLIVNS